MSIKQIRPMRRSALISPWGVGAIVPFVNDESLMIAGLDMWNYHTTAPFVIKDERLQKRLGVKELRWPPDFRDYESDSENCNLKIPAVRFPRWNYCPFCGTMQKVGLFTKQPKCDAYQWPHGRKCDASKRYRRSLIPERFVVVCPEGHIDDFPIAEWIHADSGHVYNEHTCRIRRSTGGTSAALTGVRYECSCGASKSIAGALRPGALKSIGYKCKGGKPWLGIEEDLENPCKCEDASQLRVLQRGASNVWFADTRSSIYIPTEDDTLTRRIVEIVNDPRNNTGGIGFFAAPLTNMKLHTLAEAPSAMEISSNGYGYTLSKAGLSGIVPIKGDSRAEMVKVSLMLEREFAKTIYSCFKRMFACIFDRLNLKYSWKLEMFGTLSREKEEIEEARNGMTLGILPATLRYISFFDMNLFDDLSISDAVINSKLLEKRIPLQSTYHSQAVSTGQTNVGGAGQAGTSKVEESTTKTEINKGGRPESDGITSEAKESYEDS